MKTSKKKKPIQSSKSKPLKKTGFAIDLRPNRQEQIKMAKDLMAGITDRLVLILKELPEEDSRGYQYIELLPFIVWVHACNDESLWRLNEAIIDFHKSLKQIRKK